MTLHNTYENISFKNYTQTERAHNEQKKEWGTYGMLGLIFMVLPDIIYILSDEQLIPMFLNDLNFYLYIVAAFFFLLSIYKYD